MHINKFQKFFFILCFQTYMEVWGLRKKRGMHINKQFSYFIIFILTHCILSYSIT